MRDRRLDTWEPEDEAFWEQRGRRIAWRNLLVSVFTLFLGFVVWTLWSLVVVYLPAAGFEYSESELFLLTALPSLAGATGRLAYSFVVPVFGGRRWNTFATATLVIPTLGLGFAVQNPETPFWLMAFFAVTARFGGANFSSSMDHISYFFPEREEGIALGINGGVSNVGVSAAQFLVPVVIFVDAFGRITGPAQTYLGGSAGARAMWLQNAGFVWVPFVLVGVVASYLWMNDLPDVDADISEQLSILRRKHNWLLCYLYLGTFGSFIGYAVAFPLLTSIQFPARDVSLFAFVGPLLGASIRPLGGWLSDRLGGARVTLWVFGVMIAGTALVIYTMVIGQFWGFFAAFLLLFLTSGIGNGSTFKMVPVIFRKRHLARVDESDAEERERALSRAKMEAGSVSGSAAESVPTAGFSSRRRSASPSGWPGRRPPR
ncbi:MFS transporter [Halovenus carboxidivorans]|uniref:MFS transporter n=1 Tax=Halovenus carboxidivorans TaxID=2692199 RepID=UPI001F1593F1|nr:MFS transporter [Halovenus carboxidivorans]